MSAVTNKETGLSNLPNIVLGKIGTFLGQDVVNLTQSRKKNLSQLLHSEMSEVFYGNSVLLSKALKAAKGNVKVTGEIEAGPRTIALFKNIFNNKKICDSIAELNLSSLQILSTQLKSILTTFPKLTALSLAGCRYISPQDLAQQASLIPQLTSLSLAECRYVNEQTLSQLADAFPNLKHLDVSACFLLSSIGTKFTQLESLSFASCSLNDKTLEQLAQLTCLTCLNLNESEEITDQGIRCLASLKKLKQLYLRDCPKISDEAKKYLKEQIPDLEII